MKKIDIFHPTYAEISNNLNGKLTELVRSSSMRVNFEVDNALRVQIGLDRPQEWMYFVPE